MQRAAPRPSVLIVDDDALVRRIVADILEAEGFACRAAIPVIVLTAVGRPTTVLRMQEAGSLLYLTKPITPERLLAALRAALER